MTVKMVEEIKVGRIVGKIFFHSTYDNIAYYTVAFEKNNTSIFIASIMPNVDEIKKIIDSKKKYNGFKKEWGTIKDLKRHAETTANNSQIILKMFHKLKYFDKNKIQIEKKIMKPNHMCSENHALAIIEFVKDITPQNYTNKFYSMYNWNGTAE